MKRLLITSLCILFVSSMAMADWVDGDDYKMHYPQMPDPYGWDVKAGWDNTTGFQKVLADDWMCTESGPVSDVHLWGSWRDDVRGTIESIGLSIYSDVPYDDDDNLLGYSHPGDSLWDRVFSAAEFTVLDPYGDGDGLQGWFNPNTEDYFLNDHVDFHQINITNFDDPFVQEQGKIYWLEVTVNLEAGTDIEDWGWKTTLDHWNDDAVFGDYNAAGEFLGWNELRDPISGDSLDLAFVITPEPATVFLLGMGAFSVIRKRKRK